MNRLLTLTIIISLQMGLAQVPHHLELNRSVNLDENSVPGLTSNSVVDIRRGPGDLLYFGTSGGLGFAYILPDGNLDFRSFDVANLPPGGNPGLAVKDSIIAVSGAVQEYAQGEHRPAGSGIAWSLDAGQTWQYKPQPVDPADSPRYLDLEWGGQVLQRLAVTTEINNVSYELAIAGDYIYSTSWAGGLQRFQFRNIPPVPAGDDPNPWEPIPLPMDNEFSLISGEVNTDSYELNPNDPPMGSHNHKGFSVYAVDDTLWVGTAAGINKGVPSSIPGCIDWQHYSALYDGLTGNWVVGFTHQELTDIAGQSFIRVWAITWPTESGEFYGLSYTDDGGEFWDVSDYIMENTPKIYSLSQNGERLLAAGDNGLYVTEDALQWDRFGRPGESEHGEEILSQVVYSGLDLPDTELLLVGTPDGVAVTPDDGLTWSIHRFWKATRNSDGDDRFYAYPNPFYINAVNLVDGDGHVRFVFNSSGGGSVKLRLYDFAMEQVIAMGDEMVRQTGDSQQQEIIWNGRNDWGDPVANGVYFCRLTLGSNEYWTKLLVVQ